MNLKIHSVNSEAITKITEENDLAKKPTVEIKLSPKTYPIQQKRKAGKRSKEYRRQRKNKMADFSQRYSQDKNARSNYNTTKDIKQIHANQAKAKGFRNIHHGNNKPKTAGVAALLGRKKYFKTRSINKHKKDHFTDIRGSLQQENITVLKVDAPSNRASKYMLQNVTEFKIVTQKPTMIA